MCDRKMKRIGVRCVGLPAIRDTNDFLRTIREWYNFYNSHPERERYIVVPPGMAKKGSVAKLSTLMLEIYIHIDKVFPALYNHKKLTIDICFSTEVALEKLRASSLLKGASAGVGRSQVKTAPQASDTARVCIMYFCLKPSTVTDCFT